MIDLLLFRTNGCIVKEFYSILLYAIIAVTVLFSAILLDKQTFGQRCSKEFPTEEIQNCVVKLSKGDKK